MERKAIVRRFKSNSKPQSRTRSSSSTVVPAISENRGSIEHNLSDMSKAKRVKFTHSATARPLISDVPKTSEYAFFKKLKEEMGGSCSRPLHENANQIKTANANDPKTETSIPSDIFKYNNRKLRSPLQSGKERTTYQFSFLSPPIRSESNNPWGINSNDDFREIKKRTPLPCAYVTPDGKDLALSPFPSVSKNSGDEYVGKGIFTVRRHRLRQLVANSYLEVGEGCSKGFDLVSALLSRLFPKSYENEHADLEKRALDTTYQLAALPELFSEEKISTIRDTSKFNFGSCCNGDFPEYGFGGPKRRVISQWNITNSSTPLTEYNAAIDFQNEEMNSFCGLNGEAIKKKFLENDSSCCPYFDNYQYACSGHIKQMDRFRDPNEFGREPHTLLLGWDINGEKDQHIGCALATSLNFAYQQTLDDSPNAATMHAPSSRSKYCLDFHSLPDFLSARGRGHYIGIYDEDNFAALDASHFLPFTPRCLTMAEDFDSCLEQSKVILHCQDDPWCIGKGSSRKGHSDTLPLPRGITDDLGWKLLPLREFSREDYSSSSHVFELPSNSKADVNALALVQDEESSLHCPKNRKTALTFSEDAFDIPNLFSSNFHASLDKLLGPSLLLDYLGRVRSEDITYIDDDSQRKSS